MFNAVEETMFPRNFFKVVKAFFKVVKAAHIIVKAFKYIVKILTHYNSQQVRPFL